MAEQLKQSIINVLDGRNSHINEISIDFNKKEQFQKLVDDMHLTPETFKPSLRRVAKSLLHPTKNNGRITALLLFCMELDSFHTLNSSWYERDMLIETLYNILLDVERIEAYAFWKNTFIICSIILIVINVI